MTPEKWQTQQPFRYFFSPNFVSSSFYGWLRNPLTDRNFTGKRRVCLHFFYFACRIQHVHVECFSVIESICVELLCNCDAMQIYLAFVDSLWSAHSMELFDDLFVKPAHHMGTLGYFAVWNSHLCFKENLILFVSILSSHRPLTLSFHIWRF